MHQQDQRPNTRPMYILLVGKNPFSSYWQHHWLTTCIQNVNEQSKVDKPTNLVGSQVHIHEKGQHRWWWVLQLRVGSWILIDVLAPPLCCQWLSLAIDRVLVVVGGFMSSRSRLYMVMLCLGMRPWSSFNLPCWVQGPVEKDWWVKFLWHIAASHFLGPLIPLFIFFPLLEINGVSPYPLGEGRDT